MARKWLGVTMTRNEVKQAHIVRSWREIAAFGAAYPLSLTIEHLFIQSKNNEKSDLGKVPEEALQSRIPKMQESVSMQQCYPFRSVPVHMNAQYAPV